jgi:hypothetical protein
MHIGILMLFKLRMLDFPNVKLKHMCISSSKEMLHNTLKPKLNMDYREPLQSAITPKGYRPYQKPRFLHSSEAMNRVIHGSHFSLHFHTHFWLILIFLQIKIKMSQKWV